MSEKFDFSEIRDYIMKAKLIEQEVLERLAPFFEELEKKGYSENLQFQKNREITQLGKFLTTLSKRVDIIDVFGETPDSVIRLDNFKIGIELTEFHLDNKIREKEGIIDRIFREIESELALLDANYKGLYNVTFNIRSLDLNKVNQQTLKYDILEMIQDLRLNSTIVTRIQKQVHNRITVCRSGGMISQRITEDQLTYLINRKEKKIFENDLSQFNEVWLVIIPQGIKQSSYYDTDNLEIFENRFVSKFDRIFFFNFFESKSIEILNKERSEIETKIRFGLEAIDKNAVPKFNIPKSRLGL